MKKLKLPINFLKDRAKEPTSWLAIGLFAMLGGAVPPEQATQIVGVATKVATGQVDLVQTLSVLIPIGLGLLLPEKDRSQSK